MATQSKGKKAAPKVTYATMQYLEAWREQIYREAWTRSKVSEEVNAKIAHLGEFRWSPDSLRRLMKECDVKLHESVVKRNNDSVMRGMPTVVTEAVSQVRDEIDAVKSEVEALRHLTSALLSEVTKLSVELGRPKLSDTLLSAIKELSAAPKTSA